MHAEYFQSKGYNGEALLGLTGEDVIAMPVTDTIVHKALLRTIARLNKISNH